MWVWYDVGAEDGQKWAEGKYVEKQRDGLNCWDTSLLFFRPYFLPSNIQLTSTNRFFHRKFIWVGQHYIHGRKHGRILITNFHLRPLFQFPFCPTLRFLLSFLSLLFFLFLFSFLHLPSSFLTIPSILPLFLLLLNLASPFAPLLLVKQSMPLLPIFFVATRTAVVTPLELPVEFLGIRPASLAGSKEMRIGGGFDTSTIFAGAMT